eukprot:7727238-Prorocentrum_lima.AAC.1
MSSTTPWGPLRISLRRPWLRPLSWGWARLAAPRPAGSPAPVAGAPAAASAGQGVGTEAPPPSKAMPRTAPSSSPGRVRSKNAK